MSKLSELWKEYQKIAQQGTNDPYPTGTSKDIPFEWEAEIKELNTATPPSLGWRIILFLVLAAYTVYFCYSSGANSKNSTFLFFAIVILPVIVLLINYFKKKSQYNEKMSRLYSLKSQIQNIEKFNEDLENNKQKWESRQRNRDQQLKRIISDVQKLMGSTEKYVSLLTSENTEEIENEILYQYKFTKECNECSPDDFALFRSIDPSRDIIVSENSLTVKPNNEVWNTLEQVSRRCWVAQLSYHVSMWQLNEGLKRLCTDLMLDTSLVNSTTLSDYLARQNFRLAETDWEKQLYQMITSTQWAWRYRASKQLIQQIIQNRRLREQMVTNIMKKLPAPMWELVPSSERLLKMQGKWDTDNDETAAYLNQMHIELYNTSKSVHAGNNFYVYPHIRTATVCSIPTGSEIRNIAPRAFEEVPHLRCLTIPKNIMYIDEYIFSSRATPNIIHIFYQGMQSEWNKISLTNCWDYLPNGGCIIVHCTDTSFIA